MTVSAELLEAAVLQGTRAYLLACHSHLTELGPEQEEMARRMAEHNPGSSNAVRAACLAALEFVDLRDPAMCLECSSYHNCTTCGDSFQHHENSVSERCAKCREAHCAGCGEPLSLSSGGTWGVCQRCWNNAYGG